MHRVFRAILQTFLIAIFLAVSPFLEGYSMLRNNDPLPYYTAQYPYDYLSVWERDYYRGLDEDMVRESWTVAISPFRQTADTGKNRFDVSVPLGDLYGRWNMLGLFYPSNATNPGTSDPFNLLPLVGLSVMQNPGSGPCDMNTSCQAVSQCCVTVTSVCDPTVNCPGIVNPQLNDPRRNVGYYSIPLEYRKYGMRFQVDMRLWGDVGLRVQLGAADITQTITAFTDLTLTSSGTPISGTSSGDSFSNGCDAVSGCLETSVECKEVIHEKIMNQREIFMNALGYCAQDFHEKGFEDTIFNLFWQRIFPFNDFCDGWPYFLWVPHLSVEVIAPTSKKVSPNQLFGVPLGNNGHTGYGFDAGMDFDFINSIEIGIHASMTKWTSRNYIHAPVPTIAQQSGVFPFKANYRLHPGTNWTFALALNAHYFLDRLSGYAEYQMVNHSQDCFSCMTPLPARSTNLLPTSVLVDRMQQLSRWRVHVFNFGLNYDIAPHASLGFFWQSPWARTNAYRATTVMLSFLFRF